MVHTSMANLEMDNCKSVRTGLKNVTSQDQIAETGS